MTIDELGDIIQADLVIRRYTGQNNRYCARFDDVEVKEGACLVGAHGNGRTPENAIQEYVDRIKGTTVVINARDKVYRREFNIPETLTR